MEIPPVVFVIIAGCMAAAITILMLTVLPTPPAPLYKLACWLWGGHIYGVHDVNLNGIVAGIHKVIRQTYICQRAYCGKQRDVPIDPPLQEA